ncbi:hypothetical protein [Pseudomonas sp. MOIL14HWK12:I2]|uniref:hypothetical protein n=1 Tax=Pseudomonas sp. MOIL14HWK12:I2 TaxID=1033994 RepID=UPI0003F6F5AF|nr:hypothetical protein [Pseudomonas sp. MOIL14HWK12:I2]
MRKIIQIQVLPADAESASNRLFALCDDGSLWLWASQAADGWQPLPPIPAAFPDAVADTVNKPAQAGARWTAEDDTQLAQLWYEAQLDVARIAAEVQRSEGAIVSRLVKLDFFASSEDARAANRLRRKTPVDSTPD